MKKVIVVFSVIIMCAAVAMLNTSHSGTVYAGVAGDTEVKALYNLANLFNDITKPSDELQAILDIENKDFEITTDIGLRCFALLVNNGVSFANRTVYLKSNIAYGTSIIGEHMQIGCSDHPFTGTFDGGCFEVSRFIVPFFCNIKDAIIKDLIAGNIIAKTAEDSVIVNCVNTSEDVGIAGNQSNTFIDNCVNYKTLEDEGWTSLGHTEKIEYVRGLSRKVRELYARKPFLKPLAFWGLGINEKPIITYDAESYIVDDAYAYESTLKNFAVYMIWFSYNDNRSFMDVANEDNLNKIDKRYKDALDEIENTHIIEFDDISALFSTEITRIIADSIEAFDSIYWEWAGVAEVTEMRTYETLLKEFALGMIQFSYNDTLDFMQDADASTLDTLEKRYNDSISALDSLDIYNIDGNKTDFFIAIRDVIDSAIGDFDDMYWNWFDTKIANYKNMSRTEIHEAYNQKSPLIPSGIFQEKLESACFAALEIIDKTEFTDWQTFASKLAIVVAEAQTSFEKTYAESVESNQTNTLTLVIVVGAIIIAGTLAIAIILYKKNRKLSFIAYENTNEKLGKKNQMINEKAQLLAEMARFQRERTSMVAQHEREKTELKMKIEKEYLEKKKAQQTLENFEREQVKILKKDTKEPWEKRVDIMKSGMEYKDEEDERED